MGSNTRGTFKRALLTVLVTSALRSMSVWSFIFQGAGYIAMVVQSGTIVSSLFNNRCILRFGTGRITLVNVAMTALALFRWLFAPSIGWLFACAIPLGVGGGSVDAALNHFVSMHYKSKHVS